MRLYRIGPARDRLGALLALVDRLGRAAPRREGARGRAAPPRLPERHAHEAMSAAMKLVVNSAYGYLAAGGADAVRRRPRRQRGDAPRPRGARPDVPRARRARRDPARGRHRRRLLRGARALGREADERRVVAEVAALLPPLVQLEFDGRYAAMLSHEPKNYALLDLRRRAAAARRRVPLEPRRAVRRGRSCAARIRRLLAGDVAGVRDAYLDTVRALRAARAADARRRVARAADQDAATSTWKRATRAASSPTRRCSRSGRADVVRRRARARLSRRRAAPAGVRAGARRRRRRRARPRRRGPIRATTTWSTTSACCATPSRRGSPARFTPDDFAVVFADPHQLSLFARPLGEIQTVLTVAEPPRTDDEATSIPSSLSHPSLSHPPC